MWGSQSDVEMAGTGNQQPAPSARPVPPGAPRPLPATAPRKPPQVLMLKKDEPLPAAPEPTAALQAPGAAAAPAPAPIPIAAPGRPVPVSSPKRSDEELFDMGGLEGLTMADLLGPDSGRQGRGQAASKAAAAAPVAATPVVPRSVDDFDFDADAFLAALDEQDFVGTTGEVVTGVVIALESDGVYVDIGGKAPGFMPKKECGLGAITNLKERFPKGLQV